MKLSDMATPALVVDLETLEANIARMAKHLAHTRHGLRPHAKTHKCPEIAKLQIEAGAIGVSCARLGEAEVMAKAGCRGLLITTEVVPWQAIQRLVALLEVAPDTMVAVDNAENVQTLSEAARAGGVTINVLVDVHVGGRRTGITPGAPALDLAATVSGLPGLRLCGLQGYAGQASHVAGWAARREASLNAMRELSTTRQAAEAAGLEVSVVSGGSTGTYDIDVEVEGLTELQAGSYTVMDLEYLDIGGRASAMFDDFGLALTVMATVISVTEGDRAIVDAGVKAFATDTAFEPRPMDCPNLKYVWAGDEHGRLFAGPEGVLPKLGERIRFYPPHCDPTINLYDRIHLVKGDDVVATWAVAARGPC